MLAKDAPIKQKDSTINGFKMASPKLKITQEHNCLQIYACCRSCQKPETTFSIEIALRKKDNSLDILKTMTYKHDMNRGMMPFKHAECLPLAMHVTLPLGEYQVLMRVRGHGLLVLAGTDFQHEKCPSGKGLLLCLIIYCVPCYKHFLSSFKHSYY